MIDRLGSPPNAPRARDRRSTCCRGWADEDVADPVTRCGCERSAKVILPGHRGRRAAPRDARGVGWSGGRSGGGGRRSPVPPSLLLLRQPIRPCLPRPRGRRLHGPMSDVREVHEVPCWRWRDVAEVLRTLLPPVAPRAFGVRTLAQHEHTQRRFVSAFETHGRLCRQRAVACGGGAVRRGAG